TSIDGAFANDINIFPNPTTGIVNIEAEGLNKVVVYDVTGRMMMSVANESTIDISNLEAGVYFFSVETENGSAMKKLVKE
ncbi:MAG: T9SS type A sorting domain-containing protein, partial [Bacteroidales bacterium]|nr:T9SS type A sorting domain-containing protein [Bacteroidales bacterium]